MELNEPNVWSMKHIKTYKKKKFHEDWRDSLIFVCCVQHAALFPNISSLQLQFQKSWEAVWNTYKTEYSDLHISVYLTN